MLKVELSADERADVCSALRFRAEQLNYRIGDGSFDRRPAQAEIEARALIKRWLALARRLEATA